MTAPEEVGARRARGFAWIWIAPTALVLLAAIAPLASGARTFFLRDVFNGHVALRAYLADALRRGEFPLLDPLRAGGQPLAANPNAVPFYPDNLLLLFGSSAGAASLWQLNAHFWIHGLVAFAAMYALARRFGLTREAGCVAAAIYGASGFSLSQMNLYNGVAGAALAPALAAAMLATRASEPRERRRALAAFGGLWALELLAGDPILAILALAGAVVFGWSLSRGDERRVPWGRVTLAAAAGTAVAAPQIVELARQLPSSFRSLWGSRAAEQAVGAPDPRALLDLVVPLFFGAPDTQQVWGRQAYFGGMEPLYYSLAPGVLALALVIVALRHGETRERGLWGVLVAGTLITYSSGLAGRIVAELPGGELFRYPAKLALWAALAGSLLAGLGFERLRDAAARRTLALAFGAMGFGLVAIWFLFVSGENAATRLFRELFTRGLEGPAYDALRSGWARTVVLELVLLALLAAVQLGRSRRAELGGAIPAIHVASQLLLLAPILATATAAPFRSAPPLAAEIPREAVLVHGGAFRLFGGDPYAPVGDPRFLATIEREWRELHPFAGLAEGRRYELAASPEGLDSYLVDALAVAFWRMSDAQRLAALRATGAEILLSTRPLAADAEALAEPPRRFDFPDPLYAYRLHGSLGEAQLLGERSYAPEIAAALRAISSGQLEPTRAAVVAGSGEPRNDPPGRVELGRNLAERVELVAESERGGVLVLRRAWLPQWKAEIDGREAPTAVANLTRLAVELPPGRHSVALRYDRTPFRFALGLSALGLASLALLTWRSGRAAAPG